MQRYKLCDIAKEISIRENNPATSTYDKFVGLEHYEPGEVVIRKFGSTNMLNSAMKIFRNGDVLVARRNVYLRRAATVSFEGLTSGDSIVLRADNDRIAKLLPYILNSTSFWNFAEQHADGTMSKRLSPKTLMQYEFYLPSVEEQDKLIDLLWSIDRTRQAYKQLLLATDDLVKSQFIEMFGDMESNPMGWRKSTLGEECYYIKDGPHKSPKYIDAEAGIPFISTRNVVNGDGIDWSTAKYISEEDFEECIKKCKPEKGDILYSKGGTTGIAKYIDTDRRFANWVHVAVLKFGDQLNGRFLERMLNMDYCYQQSQRLTKGIANRDFVLSAIAQVRIYVPPIDLQAQYVSFVEQSDKSKFEIKETLNTLTTAYKTIIDKSFS